MKALLDRALCDSMYRTLNEDTIFKYDEELKPLRSQICATLDRLRYAIAWINAHQDTPRGIKAPISLMTFMMFASEIKSSIENLRKCFGLQDVLFDKGKLESRKFFATTCLSAPLEICEKECPTDDDFFGYFRSLVFAHSTRVEQCKGLLKKCEVQYSPFIVQCGLKKYDSDDYVGVMIYSTEKDRDGKVLRVRFSDLKAYLKSRYDSLKLVLDMILKKIKSNREDWMKVVVDEKLSPLDQLKFMLVKFRERGQDELQWELRQIIDMLECPCSLRENSNNVERFRQEIIAVIPELVVCFKHLDFSGFFCITKRFTEHKIDQSRNCDYILQKIFECLDELDNPRRSGDLDDAEKQTLLEYDIEEVLNAFVGKWAKIDQSNMSYKEMKMLIALACYYEYGQTK